MRKTARLGNSRRAIFHSPAVFKRQWLLFVTDNHIKHSMVSLRCGQARCAESLPTGCYHITCLSLQREPQTTRHIIEEVLLTAFPGGLQRLHESGPDAVEWVARLPIKLNRECLYPNKQQQWFTLLQIPTSVQVAASSQQEPKHGSDAP